MSAARTALFLIRTLQMALAGLIGWLLIAPVALLIPRRSDLVVVIGASGGRFMDNAKYFFLQATPLLRPDVGMVFMSDYDEVVASLAKHGLAAVRYPSLRAVAMLLRCSVVVVDSGDWLLRMRRFLLIGAKTLQLWHGVGFKRVGLDKMRNEPRAWLSSPLMMRLRILNGALNGKLVRYSAFISPSRFYRDHVFREAMPAHHHMVAGYPRNTFGQFEDAGLRNTAWLNVDGVVRDSLGTWNAQGRRIVLVAPTFRDSRVTALGIDDGVARTLDAWCEREGVEMVFKFHPFERGATAINGRHLHLCAPDSDVYPLMPHAHALVTDYSSIYMDYLLLDRPVLFLVPDRDEYVKRDRQFQFDFDEMTPGPKVQTWPQLLAAVGEQWRADSFAIERARLRKLAFDDLAPHHAVPQLIAFMRKQGWIAKT